MDKLDAVGHLARRLVDETVASTGRVPDEIDRDRAWIFVTRFLDQASAAIQAGNGEALRKAFDGAWDQEAAKLAARATTANPMIGARIKQLVQESGFTVLDLARMHDVSRAQIYKIFNDEVNTSVAFVCKLLNAIGCTWSDLDYPHRGGV